MSDQSNALSRVVRWGAVALLLCVAVALYFQMGTHLVPFSAATQLEPAADAAP